MNKKAINISNLLALIEQENRLAFNMFYETYYSQVFRYAYYFVKDTEACREILTDVFFSIWQSRKKLKQIDNLDTYLFITVRNEVTRFHKRQKKHEFMSLDNIPVQIDAPKEESTEDKLVFEEMEKLLGKIIGELPEKCRVIFLLARQEGLKPKEIAEKLSISENTVRVQMKIAIEKIVHQIKPYYPDLTFSILLSFLF
ncbi:RNA polymerase sigma-70 factor [Parabacteroides sp. OttesenSCG-928-G06]|nr:RNA polymerase sigma-70 factor [Parabacteroides sp. OttesenSCG-928-G06]